MNFYVYRQDCGDPDVHLLDIFVGPQPPGSRFDFREFTSMTELQEFLVSAKVSQVCTFRHKLCPRDLIDGLNRWISSSLLLTVIPLTGDIT